MKNSRPDLSNEKVSLGLLSTIFPQLGPIARLIDDSHVVYSRASAPIGIAIQFGRTIAAAFLFLVAIVVAGKLSQYFPDSDRGNPVLRITGALFGLPAMIIILVSLNRSFDLFYLWITGKEFDKAGSGLEPVKIFLLVIGFVSSLVLAGYGWFKFEMYSYARKQKQQLRIEQQVFFSYLDKGRAAWNEYITLRPHHNIDFSHADLSKRNFKGFFFEFVHFDGADLTDTAFDDCCLSYCHFNEATFQRTSFKGSYLVGADFINTDMAGADLTGSFGDRKDFVKAKITDDQLKKLQKPEKSHWHDVSWYDYRPYEWLREKGYGISRKPKGLSF